MRCPYCAKDDDKVIDSRTTDAGKAIRRRRVCNACGKRFTTYEHVETTIRVTVIKKDGTRVPYDREHIITGVQKACYKRPISAQAITALAEDVEEEIFKKGSREVQSVEIGRLVSQRLKRLDQVAYVRFASVYKQFRDIDDLLDEVKEMLKDQPNESPDQGSLF